MKTSKDYLKNLKDRIITKEMLGECLYSVNKRAKNARDKESECRYDCAKMRKANRYFYDKYDNEEKYRRKKENYYKMKEELLKLVAPICIHEETQLRKIRVYDYEKEYNQYSPDEIIYSNSYYDKDFEEVVFFINVMVPEKKYYLFYDFGDFSFHTPITSPKEYPNMNVVQISELITYGHDIEDLISVQFVKKVIDLVRSGDFEYVA